MPLPAALGKRFSPYSCAGRFADTVRRVTPVEGDDQMRLVMITCALVSVCLGSAEAADNLVCVPPAKDLGHGGAIINAPGKWIGVGAHQTMTICVPISPSATVASLECARTQYDVVPGEVRPHSFFCDIGSLCFGGALYQSVTRQLGTGTDQICTVFSNILGNQQSSGFSYRLMKATPSRRPKTIVR
jgi:hypothetical protein